MKSVRKGPLATTSDWIVAIIIESNGENHLIHYNGFDSSWDEWVTAVRIQGIS